MYLKTPCALGFKKSLGKNYQKYMIVAKNQTAVLHSLREKLKQ